MVYTDRVIALAHVGRDKMIDVIPLDEIVNIQDCDGIGTAEADENVGRILLEISITVRPHSSRESAVCRF